MNIEKIAIDLKPLIEELKKDKSEGSLYFVWQSNIAMAFFDECKAKGSEMEDMALAELCNASAKRFLNLIIHAGG